MIRDSFGHSVVLWLELEPAQAVPCLGWLALLYQTPTRIASVCLMFVLIFVCFLIVCLVAGD
jgi:hypothetical protein